MYTKVLGSRKEKLLGKKIPLQFCLPTFYIEQSSIKSVHSVTSKAVNNLNILLPVIYLVEKVEESRKNVIFL